MINRLIACLLLSFLSVSVCAKDDYQLDLGIGAFALSMPDYPGANEQREYLVPLPYIYYQDDKVSINRQGITSSLWQKNNLYFDLSGSAGVPVKSEKNKARKGMQDIDWAVEFGTSAKYYWQGSPKAKQFVFTEAFIHKAVATDFSSFNDIGWRSGLATVIQKETILFGYPTKWSTRANINFNNATYLDYYYGVEAQYQTPQRNLFKNKSGFSGIDISSGMMMKLPSFWVGGFVKYYSFKQSEQINSPLLTDESGWAAGIGLIWIFYKNKES